MLTIADLVATWSTTYDCDVTASAQAASGPLNAADGPAKLLRLRRCMAYADIILCQNCENLEMAWLNFYRFICCEIYMQANTATWQ